MSEPKLESYLIYFLLHKLFNFVSVTLALHTLLLLSLLPLDGKLLEDIMVSFFFPLSVPQVAIIMLCTQMLSEFFLDYKVCINEKETINYYYQSSKIKLSKSY